MAWFCLRLQVPALDPIHIQGPHLSHDEAKSGLDLVAGVWLVFALGVTFGGGLDVASALLGF